MFPDVADTFTVTLRPEIAVFAAIVCAVWPLTPSETDRLGCRTSTVKVAFPVSLPFVDGPVSAAGFATSGCGALGAEKLIV